jgi:hypothetical protein
MSRHLFTDDAGNTTIPALFAGGFLIGGIFYLVGLGDAMVFHETMQDAADATSFAPSVMHARGMNVLALVNLVMSAILAILVAVKIVQLLLLAATVIACALPLNPYCPLLSSWQSPFSSFVKVTDRTVSTVNKGLYKSESAIAKMIPVIGQAKAGAASRKYAPIVEGGFVANVSLVPGGANDGRWGLPVEDEKYENLCVHASENVKDILFKPLRFLPGANVIVQPIMKFVSGLIDQLVRSFPGYFCGGAAGGIGSLGGTFKDIAKQGIAKVAESACKQAMKSAPTGQVPGGGTGSPLSMASCTSGLSASFASISGGSSLTGSKQTSKRLYEPAAMGSDYYASYGFVFSHHLEKTDPDAGLAAASWDRMPPKVLSGELDRLMSQTQFSKSEFYYDPRRGGPTAAGALTEESMLNMRWRARLRRYRPPTGESQRLVSGSGLGSILGSIRTATPGMSPASMIGLFLGRDPEEMARWADRRVGPATSRSTGGVLH